MNNNQINQNEFNRAKETFQSFLKSHSLPQNYNSIEDYENSWILYKNSHLPPMLSFPFKNITVVFGRSEDNRFKIHSIHYPKSDYSMKNILKIAQDTMQCRYCVEGQQGVIPSDISESYINVNSLRNNNDFSEDQTLVNDHGESLMDVIENTINNGINAVDKGVNEVVSPALNFIKFPTDASPKDYVISQLITAVGNEFIDIQPKMLTQLAIRAGVSIGSYLLGGIALPMVWKNCPPIIPRMFKLTGLGFGISALPGLIPGAKYDDEYWDDVLNDFDYLVDSFAQGYGIEEILDEFVDFGFDSFDFGGDYLPYEDDLGLESEEIENDLAKISM